MMLQEVLELFQFLFVVTFTTYIFHCVKYDVLFRSNGNYTKLSISDTVYPVQECVADLSGLSWSILTIAGIFWIFRIIKVCYHIVQFWDIKMFFNIALKIEDVSTIQ